MTVTWDDIGGLEDVIEQIQDTVIFPYRRRDLFTRSQLVQAPKGKQGLYHFHEYLGIDNFGSEFYERKIFHSAKICKNCFLLGGNLGSYPLLDRNVA